MAWVKTTWRAFAQLGVRYLPPRRGEPHRLPGKLVVSLTSYTPRFKTLELSLKRVLSQSVRPDVIALWIGEEHRPNLPRRVLRLADEGVTIHYLPEDIGPYMKIIPALRVYPDAFIVIADDDKWYPKDWLQRLVNGYRSNDEIVCLRAFRIKGSADALLPYREWDLLSEAASGADVFPTGVSGVLYPPGVLPPETLDEAAFKRLCPNDDDLWLYWMAAAAGRQFRRLPGPDTFRHWRGSQKHALWRSNVIGGDTDRYIRAMTEACGLPPPLVAALRKPAG